MLIKLLKAFIDYAFLIPHGKVLSIWSPTESRSISRQGGATFLTGASIMLLLTYLQF